MITKIEGNRVVVETSEKTTGTYLLADFSDEELQEEKGAAMGRLTVSAELGIGPMASLYDLIAQINGELDKRLIDRLNRPESEYFDSAVAFARIEAERLKNKEAKE